MRRLRLLAASAAVLLLVSEPSEAQKRKLSVEDLTAEPPIAGRPVTGVTWIGNGERFSWVVRNGSHDTAPSELWVEETATGRKRMVVATPGLTLPEPAEKRQKAAEKPRTASLERYSWSPDGRRVLLTGGDRVWLYDVEAGRLERVTQGTEKEELPSFSPDGARVAFVRKNDLYAVELEGRRETRLTRDGSDLVHNGKLDWVYEEELANRDARGYEWSPDGRSIAYLRLDDAPIAANPIVDFLAVPAKVEWQRYPKAGSPNPIASFRVVGVDGTARAAIPSDNDSYVVPGFSWTPDSASVSYRVLNRSQNRQEVHLLTLLPAGAPPRTLFVEEDRYWLNVVDPPRFLRDGRYLWKSERTGFAHLFVGRISGGDPQPITHGEWIVDKIAGVDEVRGSVYFTATEENVRRRPIYRVGLDGAGLRKITATPRGQHSAALSPDGRFLLDTFSTIDEPPVLSLLDSSGKTARVVDRPESRLAEFELGTNEEREVAADDGARLEARLVKPAGFDPSKKYPVIVYVYGGPHSQVVRDAWGATTLLDHLLASRGYLVWSLDNRGSFGRGHAWEAALFRDMGRRELADQLAGVRFLKSLPFVDGERIGIWGWSYGGYMTLFSLTRAPDVWKCGVAGAPVTHWKFYDTIYTERYMGTPQENPTGYESSAPLSKARDIAAPLLIIHGGSDDNVHVQNTIAFVDALVRAGKPHELQVQPRQKHGFRGPESLNFRNRAIVRFFEQNLR
ncbi:MAG TPA: S9 family peptidase [Thermoanaerobaculia bacterium]|nr:S9 family peptidase [Thermoanaerobaculia bacterium]